MRWVGLCGSLALSVSALADVRQTFELDVQLEARAYTENALYPEQKDGYLSLALTPEWYLEGEGGRYSITATAFARADSADSERSHGDIRELHWQGVFDNWELRLGVSRVFWGRTELLHLVDTINQDDALENLDGEDKLGQPMLRLNYVALDSSTQLYVLPYFRERRFPGEEGRLRPPLPVDDHSPIYESGAEQRHVDWALRHQGWRGGLDYGIAWFSGTQRDPKFVPGPSLLSLRPYYGLMDQFSVDAQYTAGSWLWKLEALWREEFNDLGSTLNSLIEARETYSAATVGLEYSFFGVWNSASDIGVLLEYLWDERDEAGSVFQNDIFLGTRWAANDPWDSALLAGVVYDPDYHSQFYTLEYSRRMSGHSKLSVEARVFNRIPAQDATFFPLRRDDYLQLEYNWYF